MRVPVAALLFCLVGAPSHAFTLSTSGAGLAPCGEQMCVDVDWHWGSGSESTVESSGEISLVLPIPDPAIWTLSGGSVHSVGSAFFAAWFDPSAVALVTDPPGDTFVGFLGVEYLVLGANGGIVLQNNTGLYANCDLGVPAGDPIPCGDSNGMGSIDYFALSGDGAFLGPLALRYDFHPEGFEIVPLSALYGLNASGTAHLIYERIVPEPHTGLLLVTGLLGIAYQRRRCGA